MACQGFSENATITGRTGATSGCWFQSFYEGQTFLYSLVKKLSKAQ